MSGENSHNKSFEISTNEAAPEVTGVYKEKKYVCKNVYAWGLPANPASWDQVALQRISLKTLLWHVTEKEQGWLQCQGRTPMDGYKE